MTAPPDPADAEPAADQPPPEQEPPTQSQSPYAGYAQPYPGSVRPKPGYSYGQPYPSYTQPQRPGSSPSPQPPAYPYAHPQQPPAYPYANPQRPPSSQHPYPYQQPPAYPYPPPASPYGYSPPPGPYAYYRPPEYAGWWERAAAYLLDLLLILPFWIGQLVVQLTTSSDNNAAGLSGLDTMSTTGIVLYFLLLVVGFAVNVWNRSYRAGKTGQSLGRKWMGISLVFEQTGQPIGGWRAFGRDLLHILDWLCFIGFLAAAVTDKRQTFADMIMKTIVVRA